MADLVSSGSSLKENIAGPITGRAEGHRRPDFRPFPA